MIALRRIGAAGNLKLRSKKQALNLATPYSVIEKGCYGNVRKANCLCTDEVYRAI